MVKLLFNRVVYIHFFCNLRPLISSAQLIGEMAEWSKAHAWRACIPRETVSRVRIPLSPLVRHIL